jgi:hypothetical protein
MKQQRGAMHITPTCYNISYEQFCEAPTYCLQGKSNQLI